MARPRLQSSLFSRRQSPYTFGPYICARCAHHAAKQELPLIYERPATSNRPPASTTTSPPARRPSRATRRPQKPQQLNSTPRQVNVSTSGSSHDGARSSQLPQSSDFASYAPTTPIPNPAQLAYANRFFTTARPEFLVSSAKFRQLPVSSVPEVAFLGRSNVGKSSLVNALLCRETAKIAHVSSKPGRTRLMNAFGVGPRAGSESGVRLVNDAVVARDGGAAENDEGGEVKKVFQRIVGRGGLVVLDMPGYGKGSREEWGPEIVKYLLGRKQLRRVFVLINSQHGVKTSDAQLLTLLRENNVTHQIVLTKIDRVILPSGKVTDQLLANMSRISAVSDTVRKQTQMKKRGELDPLEDILTCSAQVDIPKGSGNKIGIDNLRWAVLSATGLECDQHGNKRVLDVNVEPDAEREHYADLEHSGSTPEARGIATS